MEVDTIQMRIVFYDDGRTENFQFFEFLFCRRSTLVNFDGSMQLHIITTFECFHRNATSPSLLAGKSLSPRLKVSSLLSEEPSASCFSFFCFCSFAAFFFLFSISGRSFLFCRTTPAKFQLIFSAALAM